MARRRRDVAALACAVAVVACRRAPTPPTPPAPTTVPRATGPIAIDGDWDEAPWARAALRFVLRDASGAPARPASEVRVLQDDRDLLIALYAADEDITSADRFELSIGALSLRASPTGAIEPAIPGARVRAGLDEGTLDDPRDDDEEWVVELAIPLAAFAGAPTLALAARRCDTPKDGVPRCGAFATDATAAPGTSAPPLAVVYPSTR